VETPRHAATFIVRVSRDGAGKLIGSVQRARTGERRPFHQAEAIGGLISEMTGTGVAADAAPDAPDSPAPPGHVSPPSGPGGIPNPEASPSSGPSVEGGGREIAAPRPEA
jgi:hypothetical protein